MARVGLSTNEVEIDNQFLKTSGGLAGQVLTSSTAPGISITGIGQVTGIRLDHSIIGAIAVKWAKVRLAQSYEIQVCTDKTFILGRFETYNVGQEMTSWIFEHGNPEQEYFVRIRARDASGDTGDWSGLLNTKTGVVEANHLIGGSTGNLVVYTFTDFSEPIMGGGFNWYSGYGYAHGHPTNPTLYDATMGFAEVESIGGLMFVFIHFESEMAFSYVDKFWTTVNYSEGQYVVFELWMDGEFLTSSFFGRYHDPAEFFACITRNTPLMIGIPTAPGVGLHEYFVRVVLCQEILVNADGSVQGPDPADMVINFVFAFEPQKLTMAFFEKVR